MENIKYYDNVDCILTQNSKSNFVKQNNGIKFGIIGAVLFIDKNNFLYNMHNSQNNYSNVITWYDLVTKTTVLFTNLAYDYNGVLNPENQDAYNELAKEPNLNNLIPIHCSYNSDNDVSINITIKPNTITFKNSNNTDLAIDGIAFISVPYVQEKCDLKCELYEEQDKYVSLITYFADEDDNDKKIWILNNQDPLLTFNVNIHFHFTEDHIYADSIYQNNLQDGIHIINNGKTNKNLKEINTFGGTTNLLIG